MAISAAVSSSSASPEREVADPADFAQSCCFAGANWRFSFTDSPRAAVRNLRRNEVEAFWMLADEMFGLTGAGLAAAKLNGTIIEVICDV